MAICPSAPLPAPPPLTYRASIEVSADLAEALAARLELARTPAATAVTLFERGGGKAQVSAYYAEESPRSALAALLAGAGDAGLAALVIEPVPERNWIAESEALRGPVRAGRFLVHGSHDRRRWAKGAWAIEIDASLAFGTAHHASTKGCLVALDRLLKAGRQKTVLDIGTGSGVLAIAATKASNITALATDNDPVAVAIAAENARKNRVGNRVRALRAGGLAHPLLRRRRVDLLFANLLLTPLVVLAPDFARALCPGGTAVLSGILVAQAPQVEARYRALGFILKARIVLGDWTTLILSRRSQARVRD